MHLPPGNHFSASFWRNCLFWFWFKMLSSSQNFDLDEYQLDEIKLTVNHLQQHSLFQNINLTVNEDLNDHHGCKRRKTSLKYNFQDWMGIESDESLRYRCSALTDWALKPQLGQQFIFSLFIVYLQFASYNMRLTCSCNLWKGIFFHKNKEPWHNSKYSFVHFRTIH